MIWRTGSHTSTGCSDDARRQSAGTAAIERRDALWQRPCNESTGGSAVDNTKGRTPMLEDRFFEIEGQLTKEEARPPDPRREGRLRLLASRGKGASCASIG